ETRDCIYAQGELLNEVCNVIDTGGSDLGDEPLLVQEREQDEIEREEADDNVFIIKGKDGITAAEDEVEKKLIKSIKPVVLAVNKMDNPEMHAQIYEYYSLGFGEPYPISGSHGLGLGDLLDAVVKKFPSLPEDEKDDDIISFCVIGRPNVGKSSL